jgi:hypothetical protein
MSYPTETDWTLIHLAADKFGRHPVQYYRDDGALVLVWDPPLTAQEQQRLDLWKGLVRSAVQISPDEWETLAPLLDSVRTHRARSSAEWSSMTAAQRDTVLIDWLRALTDVVRALLRG